MREISRYFVAPPRAFPLSIWATFTREIQIVTQKFTHLSITLAASCQLPFQLYEFLRNPAFHIVLLFILKEIWRPFQEIFLQYFLVWGPSGGETDHL